MTKRKLTRPTPPAVPYSKEVMRNYALSDLEKKGTIGVTVGEVVALKCLAIRSGFTELADKLRKCEKQILKPRKRNT